MQLTFRLMAVLGKRAFVSFTIVTFLVAALLAAVQIVSRYALKRFVEDQLHRIPWDIAVYQTGGVPSEDEIADRMRGVGGLERVEQMAFLRASFPAGGEVGAAVDGKPLNTPWICMLAATDPSLLPPQMQFALGSLHRKDLANGEEPPGILALVGPERSISQAFLALQGARNFSITVNIGGVESRTAFATPIRGVIRQDRDELNRWIMDQTGSISHIPYVSTILLTPYERHFLAQFNALATGLVPTDLIGPGEEQFGHIEQAEYLPEVIYLGRLDRAKLISGWDVPGSLERVRQMRERLVDSLQVMGTTSFSGAVDSTTLVLLERMDRIARLIGVVSLLIALPLLWMAWVLAANLSSLLMLNERRKFGLLRLRGIPAVLMGRALMGSVLGGGFLGGLAGLAAGSALPLLIYERGHLPLAVLLERQQLLLLAIFFVVTLVLTLEVSRRFILYAVRISPLEASQRMAGSEAASAMVQFGIPQFLSLAVGAYKLVGWIFGIALASQTRIPAAGAIDHLLDFVGLPLFLYGLATLIASRQSWIQRLLEPLIRPMGGRLGRFALRGIAAKPHRAVAFLLIVALMASVSLYPIVAARSFEDKAVRGARVQLGAEWQLTYNSPDLVEAGELQGGLEPQYKALEPRIREIKDALMRVLGVESVTVMLESILPSFYYPGYGLRGVPLYLISNPEEYLRNVYSEPELGLTEAFRAVMERVRQGGVALSPSVGEFWRMPVGAPLILGRDAEQRTLSASVSGVVSFLPGMPPQAVTDRQGYVQARLDYLNYLFSNDAYLVGWAEDPELSGLRVLIPRVIALVRLQRGVDPESIRAALLEASPAVPLEMHSLPEQVQKAGSDMYIFLALENIRIFLAGGLLLTLIGVLAIALANYAEERHTLALLRIRGASPNNIWRFLLSMMLAPALLGLILGALAALASGYGLANYLWKLREIKTAVGLLHTRLVISGFTAEVLVLSILFLVGVASLFSLWVFRKTAHQGTQEG